MCISPRSIPNPNRYSLVMKREGAPNLVIGTSKDNQFNQYKDASCDFISVPCGHCHECIQSKQASLAQRTQMLALDHHLFFITLTYDDKHLPSIETSSGYRLNYANYEHISRMFKRIRNNDLLGRPFKYIAVSEYGTAKHRPHWHLILAVKKYDEDNALTTYQLEQDYWQIIKDEWKVNVAVDASGRPNHRCPVYEPLFTYVRRVKRGKVYKNYDLHYIDTTVDSDCTSVSYYVSKYIMKADPYVERLKSAIHMNYTAEEAKTLWNLLKPRMLASKGWSNLSSPKVHDHIRSGYDLAHRENETHPLFINPLNGKTYGLAQCYAKVFTTIDDLELFKARKLAKGEIISDAWDTIVKVSDDPTLEREKQVIRKQKFEAAKKLVTDTIYIADNSVEDDNREENLEFTKIIPIFATTDQEFTFITEYDRKQTRDQAHNDADFLLDATDFEDVFDADEQVYQLPNNGGLISRSLLADCLF